ncbi:MAG: hypothetical protein SP1CHLAM54_08340 [Chlamydiia bacterium]|nr:hypothetical protein [Chlamydiia bacterium]MCH9615740.1 hypothetical protein [Chlamydiia bacterium]MCH9628857.1 hypothetical protein [Chlamydiia bacterium]
MNKKLPINQKQSRWPFSALFENGDFFTSTPMVSNIDNTGLSVCEENNHLIIEAALPGLHMNDIEVSIEKNTLWIKGECLTRKEDKDRYYYQKCHRTYSYAVPLPGDFDKASEASAEYLDGMIIVKLPKGEKHKPRKIPINKKGE